ncbi:class D sortase [Paenibacillus sp. UNC499MF]|uniref:class D sortase n=1 Tax=Paenibacillus sp. UNC499MF TaxID=1502751 RepID=UPI0008A094DE|nr:class D sortase [Paenibacillus sp. UNC499MF]SEF70276.1 sortase A [Paenibacillus sp. UNC499MF]
MKKTIFPLLCVILGIAVFLYPALRDRYDDIQQSKLLEQWQANLHNIDQSEPENETDASSAGQAPSTTEDSITLATGGKNIEGILVIDKIRLKLPILTDATKENLKISLASIAKTGKPGQIGNYAVAGHRNFAYGKNFNRLDEMTQGDTIEVDTSSGRFIYRVQEKRYVLPEQVEVLQGNGKDSEITLITCHPMKNPTHRIIVKGTLIESRAV